MFRRFLPSSSGQPKNKKTTRLQWVLIIFITGILAAALGFNGLAIANAAFATSLLYVAATKYIFDWIVRWITRHKTKRSIAAASPAGNPLPNAFPDGSAVVTLVHGTWGQNSVWTKEGSVLRCYLGKELVNQLVIRRFLWSGGNSVSARSNAAIALQNHLRDVIAEYPRSRHYIISHSHGGNVALYALRDENLLARVSGLICLSTPFLYAHKRSLGPFKDATLGVLSLVIVFVICAVLSLWLAFQFGISLPEISWTVIFVFGTGFISLAIASWHTLSNRIIAKFTPPPVPQSKLLIIRMSADEASGILTTSQFGGWVLARMWSMVSNICGKVSSWQNKWAEIRDRNIWISSSVWLVAMIFVVATVWLQTSGPDDGPVLPSLSRTLVIILCSLVAIPVLLGWFSLFASGVTALICLALVVPLSIVALPFGPELVLVSLLTEVSAEATPPGFAQSLRFDSQSTDGLAHCQAYDDERVLRCLTDWINAWHDESLRPGGPEAVRL